MRDLIVVHGGNKTTPTICRAAGWAYGVQHGYTAYGPVAMMDWIGATNWRSYLLALARAKPRIAVVADFRAPQEVRAVLSRAADVASLGVVPVVAAKFPGALAHLPPQIEGVTLRIGVSVPTSHLNDGHLPPRLEFDVRHELHFLGGHPDQWAYLTHYYQPVADVVSADGNIALRQARWGKFWDSNGGYLDLRGQGFSTEILAIQGLRNTAAYLEAGRWTSRPRVLKCMQALGELPTQKPLFAFAGGRYA